MELYKTAGINRPNHKETFELAGVFPKPPILNNPTKVIANN